MPNDIFISYSRKDSDQALPFADRLRSSGKEVWVDREGINWGERWATTIVNGIEACSTFVVLLSPNSIESENVLRELSIASEKGKHILPVELAPVSLPASFKYALVGLPRLSVGGALETLIGQQPANKHLATAREDERKSLMVMPFEDLSPGSDNAWFADGLTEELISALSNVKSLRLLDRRSTMEFKNFRGKTMDIARELSIRYFVQGSVRKFDDQIKISIELLDIESGDYLWHNSIRGVFSDIFEIQESVAKKVVDGLKLSLSPDEQWKLQKRGTTNAEAYEYWLKGQEYFRQQTREGADNATTLCEQALLLDPQFAEAALLKGHALSMIYQYYKRNPDILAESERLIRQSLRLNPELWEAYSPLSLLYALQKRFDESEALAREFIRHAPDASGGYFALGSQFALKGSMEQAVEAYEEAVRRDPTRLANLWNLVGACSDSEHFAEKRAYWSQQAVPVFERHLKLHPDDEAVRVGYGLLLFNTGRFEDARGVVEQFSALRDGQSLHNAAYLQVQLGDIEGAIRSIRRAIESGYKEPTTLSGFMEAIQEHSNVPSYPEVKAMIDKILITSGES